MHKSKASRLVVPKHLKPPICTGEAAGFHKYVKRIHDPVKFVVPSSVSRVQSLTSGRVAVAIGEVFNGIHGIKSVKTRRMGFEFLGPSKF